MAEASQFLEKLEDDIAKLKVQLDKLRAAKPVDEMTVGPWWWSSSPYHSHRDGARLGR